MQGVTSIHVSVRSHRALVVPILRGMLSHCAQLRYFLTKRSMIVRMGRKLSIAMVLVCGLGLEWESLLAVRR